MNSLNTSINSAGLLKTDTTNNNIMSKFNLENISWFKVGIIILILGLIGFNVFTYLGNIMDFFRKLFAPIFGTAVGTASNVIGETAKQTIEVSSEGAKTAIGSIASGATSGISEVQNILDKGVVQQTQLSNNQNQTRIRNNIDGKGLDLNYMNDKPFVINQTNEEVDTSFVGKRTKGKNQEQTTGYCYIGEDRGNRSCIYVGKNDNCMSGQIYPTMDVCINPNLRP